MDTTQDRNITIHPMSSEDVEIIMQNYTEQGWEKPKEVIEGYFDKQKKGDIYVFIAKYDDCQNDDELVLYLLKNLRTV